MDPQSGSEVTDMGATFGLVDRLLWDSPVGWAYAKVVPRSHAGVYADVAEVLALRALPRCLAHRGQPHHQLHPNRPLTARVHAAPVLHPQR